MKCRSTRFPFLKFNWDTFSNIIGHLKKALLPKSVKLIELWYFCENEDCFNPIRPGGAGAQRPGWPNSQLPIRNLLPYDAQTWWLLVFILKTPFGQILAKLVNQGGRCCSFLIETSQKLWKWKFFLCLKSAEIDMGGQFWVDKNDSGNKNPFLKR